MIELPGKERKIHISDFSYASDLGIYEPLGSRAYTQSHFGYSDGVEKENYILDVLKNAHDLSDDSEELMSYVKDWSSYYHLGMGRSNILKALSLSQGARALELGAGCGAITRYLGENLASVDSIEGSPLRARIAHERCRDLQNVRIFMANLLDMTFEPAYDIVTLIGVLEYAPVFFNDSSRDAASSCLELLRLARKALKKDGILILAIENRLGLKYLSGCPEDHSGMIYEGIHGYAIKQGPITLSKKELAELIKKSGFRELSFFHCFPDYKFAETIISETCQEDNLYLHNWIGTPFSTPEHERNYTFHEGLALRTLNNAGLLRELANSFLVVAGKDQDLPRSLARPSWVAKKFSSTRKRVYQCITTLETQPEIGIRKKRLYPWGKKDKAQTGWIHHLVKDVPWLDGDLMLFDAFEALMGEHETPGRISEMLVKYHSALMGMFSTGNSNKEGYPLLKEESLDFIPRNIVKHGNYLRPIDLEWNTSYPVAADYVMYRCIATDIIGSQGPYFRKIMGKTDKFIIDQIRRFFPGYNEKRHAENIETEREFQNSIRVNPAIEGIIKKPDSEGILANILARIPPSLRKKLLYIIRKSRKWQGPKMYR